MEKHKTRHSVLKRYKKTASGNFMRKKAFRAHLLGKKSSVRKQRLGRRVVVTNVEKRTVEKMI